MQTSRVIASKNIEQCLVTFRCPFSHQLCMQLAAFQRCLARLFFTHGFNSLPVSRPFSVERVIPVIILERLVMWQWTAQLFLVVDPVIGKMRLK